MFTNLNIWQFIGIYLVLQIVYVILNTVTNIAKIKCSKLVASVCSAVCYGFYVIVVVATASDYSIWVKMVLTAVTNLVGVYIGMLVMEKMRKDRLWKIEATIKGEEWSALALALAEKDISHTYIVLNDKLVVFNIYSKSQAESSIVKDLLAKYNAKYLITESTLRL